MLPHNCVLHMVAQANQDFPVLAWLTDADARVFCACGR